MTRFDRFARGFYRQARADFGTFLRLEHDGEIPTCHRLHYLQMACEKLAKAYQFRSRRPNEQDLLSRHAQIEHALPLIVREVYRRASPASKNLGRLLIKLEHLARQLDLLSPSVDDGGRRPDNCEYPWESGDMVVIPAEYEFPSMQLLHGDPAGRTLLNKILPIVFGRDYGFFDEATDRDHA